MLSDTIQLAFCLLPLGRHVTGLHTELVQIKKCMVDLSVVCMRTLRSDGEVACPRVAVSWNQPSVSCLVLLCVCCTH